MTKNTMKKTAYIYNSNGKMVKKIQTNAEVGDRVKTPNGYGIAQPRFCLILPEECAGWNKEDFIPPRTPRKKGHSIWHARASDEEK